MLTEKQNLDLSKMLSYILRHNPGQFGIILDEEGYCECTELIQAVHSNRKLQWVTQEHIEEVVSRCEKQRYEFKNTMIRARYGHSAHKVAYLQGTPPDLLYHGTYVDVVDIIFKEGISNMGRHYVHSSETTGFASLAGQRRGVLALIKIDTKEAMKRNVRFFYAGNEVWLSDPIPPECLSK